jgi:large subunit ribosomal protein L24
MSKSKVHLRKDDMVEVISGQYKGQSGKVAKVLLKKNQAIVEGVRTIVKATRPTQNDKGGLVKKDGPIHVSNLRVVAAVEKKEPKAAKAAPKKAPAEKKAPAKKKAAKADKE